MKPLTAAEVRAEVSRLPAEYRDNALRLLASAWDEGLGAGLANMARAKNPFLAAVPTATKGNAR